MWSAFSFKRAKRGVCDVREMSDADAERKRKQNAKRQADLKAKRRREGRKPLELWPLQEHRQSIKDFAAKLEA